MIYNEDCLTGLQKLPPNSIDCCITSPPYYGLRDYGTDGQIGLEETPEQYVQKIVEVFREVRKALKKEGTLWLNLGDSYAGHNSVASNNGRAGFGNPREFVSNRISGDLKTKDLIGIPWMVAFALRSDGWYLRQDIIWHKPNPMPESVRDRCTKAHEYIFLLSKSRKYYYDQGAIRTPLAQSSKTRLAQDIENQKGSNRIPGKTNGPMKTRGSEEAGANKRSVWTVSTKPFKEAHFATFPEDLITPCVLAGCPPEGVVLDPFMGAGTTALVALKNNRRYLGYELNKEYIGIANKRILDYLELF